MKMWMNQTEKQIMDQLLVPLKDIVWAASFDPGDGASEENRTMLARADAGLPSSPVMEDVDARIPRH